MQIEQAVYGDYDTGGYRFLARSPQFLEEWLSEAEKLCTGFGERPAGVACPRAVFARPFERRYVAVVQVADQGRDDSGRPGALGFHVIVLSRALYLDLGGDPFFIADQLTPPWAARGLVPTVTWNATAAPPRTVDLLQKTLNVAYSATLLGSVQILLDGGRLVFERNAPDDAILRRLWALLPTSERARMWPASFAFSNEHPFHAVVVPRAGGSTYDSYVSEEKAGDYPEGRFECNLQSAIETGDQREIDALLNYNRSKVLRLTVALLLIVVLLSLAASLLLPEKPSRPPASSSKAVSPLDLPSEDQCPRLSADERKELASRLRLLGSRFGLDISDECSDEAITTALSALDKRLSAGGKPTKPLVNYGPIQRQLRVLLWKQGVAAYNERGLNTVELLERLEDKLRE